MVLEFDSWTIGRRDCASRLMAVKPARRLNAHRSFSITDGIRASVAPLRRVKFNINWISFCLAVYVFGYYGYYGFIYYQRQQRIDIYVARVAASLDAAQAARAALAERAARAALAERAARTERQSR